MAAPRHVAVVVGSLRKESFTRKIARAVVELAPTGLAFEFVEIGPLPPYNMDRAGREALTPAPRRPRPSHARVT
jgi:chromate reductase